MLLVKIKTPHGAVILQLIPANATAQEKEYVNLYQRQLNALEETKEVVKNSPVVTGIQLFKRVRKLIVNHLTIVILI